MEYALSKKVKEICKEKGIQLKDLAEKMSIQPESLSRALNGNPQLSTISHIADALDVPIGDLFMSSTEYHNPYGIEAYIFYNGKLQRAIGLEPLLRTVNRITEEISEIEGKDIIWLSNPPKQLK